MSVITHVTGRIKDDEHADLKYAPSGVAVLTLRFSKNVGTKDKPEFNNFKAVLFGKQGESLAKFIKGGTTFALSGRQKVVTYEKRDGTGMGVSIEIVVTDFEFTGDNKTESKKEEETEEENIPF